jgi:hypothetical protein
MDFGQPMVQHLAREQLQPTERARLPAQRHTAACGAAGPSSDVGAQHAAAAWWRRAGGAVRARGVRALAGAARAPAPVSAPRLECQALNAQLQGPVVHQPLRVASGVPRAGGAQLLWAGTARTAGAGAPVAAQAGAELAQHE